MKKKQENVWVQLYGLKNQDTSGRKWEISLFERQMDLRFFGNKKNKMM